MKIDCENLWERVVGLCQSEMNHQMWVGGICWPSTWNPCKLSNIEGNLSPHHSASTMLLHPDTNFHQLFPRVDHIHAWVVVWSWEYVNQQMRPFCKVFWCWLVIEMSLEWIWEVWYRQWSWNVWESTWAHIVVGVIV